jgi:hypothetical protein
MIRDHPHSIATEKGHLDQTRSGLDSTFMIEARSTIFADLTGRFPHVSARGMDYIMCTRCSDSNYIHIEPMRSRVAKDFTATFEKCVSFFRDHGIVHKHVKMDNETSGLFRESLKKLDMQVEFIPPENHRQSPIEREIRTVKNHFISTLASIDPEFPINEWDLLLPQSEMTLNLMRPSHTRDQSSAYEHLHGKDDFLRNPIAPIGTQVIIHESPDSRPSWSPHGVKGYYIGPAMEHYRSYRILIEATKKTRVSDSVSWHPKSKFHEILTETFSSSVNVPLLMQQHRNVPTTQVDVLHPLSSSNSSFTPVSPPDLFPVDSISPATTQESMSDTDSPIPVIVKPSRKSQRLPKPKKWYGESVSKFAGMAHSYKSVCKGPEKELWFKAASEEFDRLIETTGTMSLIPWSKKPSNRKASYYNPQVRIKYKIWRKHN